jgi:hypothetical protein
MLERENKNTGQVILETVIVLIVLAVIAIGAINLFSNVNTQMLDRLNIYRQTRLHSLNNPNAATLRRAVSVAPYSARARRPLSDPTTFLDYLPRGSVSITPDIPTGSFSWDNVDSDPTSYELQLVMGLALRYKLNQGAYLARAITLQNLPSGGYIFLPNINYFRGAKRALSRAVGSLLRAKTLILALLVQFESDPIKRLEATNYINTVFNEAGSQLNQINSDIGRVVRDRFTRLYSLAQAHIDAVERLDMLIGVRAYTVDEYATNAEGELEDPLRIIEVGAENPMQALYDEAGINCQECFENAITDPFFSQNIINTLQGVSYYASGDMTISTCRYIIKELDKIKDDAAFQSSLLYKTFDTLYKRLENLLNNYDSRTWRDENARNLRILCKLEARYLYISAEMARP